MTSRLSATISQRLSGESTPPGYRQDIPTTATGSVERSSRLRFCVLSRSTWTSAFRSASVACSSWLTMRSHLLSDVHAG
jgi:hypothetical protein